MKAAAARSQNDCWKWAFTGGLCKFIEVREVMSLEYAQTKGRLCAFVITDTAAEIIAGPCYEADLRYRRLIEARPRIHITDLGDLTFRLLHRCKDFGAKRLARQGPGAMRTSVPSPCLLLALPIATNLPSSRFAQNT